MGRGPRRLLPHLIETLREQDGEARATVLGLSCLLRARDGGIEAATRLGDGFGRLRHALDDREVAIRQSVRAAAGDGSMQCCEVVRVRSAPMLDGRRHCGDLC